MKRFYAFFTLLVAAVSFFAIGAAAQEDVHFTIKTNDYEHLVVTCYGANVALTGETTELTCAQYTSYYVTSADGYIIESITCEGGYPPSVSNNMASLYPYDGYVYTINVVNLAEVRTGKFTVKVDDPSKFTATLYGTNEQLNLSAGTQEIPFAPSIESHLTIRTNTGSALYKVTLDGVNQTYNYGYTIDLTDGCVLDIQADFPDEPCDITFKYTDPKGKGFWTKATVNNTEVADFDGEKLTVKLGDNVMLTGNTSEYKYSNPIIDGTPAQYFYGTYSFTAMANTEIEIDAHPYGDLTFTLNLDNPDNVTVYKGSRYGNNGTYSGLVAGNNTLTISENIGSIQIVANAGCFVTSITDRDGNSLGESVTVTDGMEIFVTSGQVELDGQFIVWVDDPSAPVYYFGGVTMEVGSDRKTVSLAAGYNEVDFVTAQNQIQIGWAGAPVNRLYLNGEEQFDQYQSYSFYLNVVNNDVIKIFLAAEPEEITVKLTAEGNADALAAAEITRDIVTHVTDWQNTTETVFNGTRYSIKGDDVAVKFNGADVEKGDDGLFTVVIPSGAENPEITVTGTDAIQGIAVDEAASSDAVYNLQGVRVGSRSTIGTLPAGLYIVGSAKSAEKIYVK